MRFNVVGECVYVINKGEQDKEGAIVLSENVARKITELLVSTEQESVNVDFLIDFTCSEFGINKSDLKRKTRRRDIVLARYIIFYVLYMSSPHPSLAQVGAVFNKNHATVLHGLSVVETILEVKDRLYFGTVSKILTTFMPDFVY